MNPVVRSDIEVSQLLDSVGAVGGYDKERRNNLLDILDVDLSWRMHQVTIWLLLISLPLWIVCHYADFWRRKTSGPALHGTYG